MKKYIYLEELILEMVRADNKTVNAEIMREYEKRHGLRPDKNLVSHYRRVLCDNGDIPYRFYGHGYCSNHA